MASAVRWGDDDEEEGDGNGKLERDLTIRRLGEALPSWQSSTLKRTDQQGLQMTFVADDDDAPG